MNERTILFCLMILMISAITTSVIAADNKQQPSIQPVIADSGGSPTQQLTRSPAAGEQIKWQVIAAGGNRGTSTNFILSGTAGQTAVGSGASTNFRVGQGFWQNCAAGCDDCGDANSDGSIDISDAVFLIAYIFAGGPAPGPCITPNGMGDANGDSSVDISDAVYLIAYIFGGGPAPHCP